MLGALQVRFFICTFLHSGIEGKREKPPWWAFASECFFSRFAPLLAPFVFKGIFGRAAGFVHIVIKY